MAEAMNAYTIFFRIDYFIVYIDKQINSLLNQVLHHPLFQRLEASWRGLFYLTQLPFTLKNSSLKIKLLPITWPELTKDLNRAVEVDQSQIFLKVYNEEFGHPGGEPFGLLLGDYTISCLTGSQSDIPALRAIAKMAAAAFTPFIAALAPNFFGLADFTELERTIDLQRLFQLEHYHHWNLLRQEEEANFIGLVLPEVLMRQPYNQQRLIRHPLSFTEKINTIHDYLWGNSAYCFAANIMRAFHHSGWFTEIRGLPANAPGGRVMDVIESSFPADNTLPALNAPIKINLTDSQEKKFSDFGIIALSATEKTQGLVFYECPSIKKPLYFTHQNANQNSKLSMMLHYMLCVSRFAHYLKIIARNKIGVLASAKECEEYLQNWLLQYAATGNELSEEMRTRYPLRHGKVVVSERLGDIGCWMCTLYLCPRDQFDQIEAHLQFKTELIRKF